MMSAFVMNSKVGMLIGAGIGIVITVWFIVSPYPLLPNNDVMHFYFIYFISVAMCLPIILSGAISGAIIEGIYIHKFILSKQILITYKTGSVAGCIIGGLLLFPIGVFLGVILNGTLGGAIFGAIGEKIGISKIALPIGIALGIITGVVVVTLIGAAIGMWVGLLLNIAVKKLMSLLSVGLIKRK